MEVGLSEEFRDVEYFESFFREGERRDGFDFQRCGVAKTRLVAPRIVTRIQNTRERRSTGQRGDLEGTIDEQWAWSVTLVLCSTS